MCLLIAASALAQPEYDRANRERAAADAANREHLRMTLENNRPVDSKWGSATGVFDRLSGTATKKTGWTEAEHRKFLDDQKREQDQKMAVIMKQFAADKIQDGGRSAAYTQYYKELGYFNDVEVTRLQELTKKFSAEVNPYADYYLSFGARYKAYLEIADTGSFAEVIAALEPFAILPHTALKGLQKLEVRFPARQPDIDQAVLAILPNYFEMVHGLGGVYSPEYYSCCVQKSPDYMDWADLFFGMAAKYPDSVAKNLVLGKYGTLIWNDPFRNARRQLEYNERYKRKRDAARKTKEINEAEAAIQPKIQYWKAVLNEK